VRAGRREQRFLNAKRTLQKAVALRGEGAVTGKLRRRYRGADVIDLLSGGEWTIERDANHFAAAGLLARNYGSSFFAFKNDTHVRDARCVGIHPRSDISKDLCGKLAVLLLGPNVAASVISHDKPRKSALIRGPTWIQANESTAQFERIISK